MHRTTLHVRDLSALCVVKMAQEPSQRALMTIVRRMPEELVQILLHEMIDQNTITDDRLVAFFTVARNVLDLKGCSNIRKSILRQIPFRCPELRFLDLTNCLQVNNTLVRAILQDCSALQSLKLDGCRHLTDAAFQPDHSPFYPLRACTALQVVSFARCSQLTKDLILFLLKSCHSLTQINLSRCKRIQSDAVQMLLCSSFRLESLDLSFMEINDSAFVTVPNDSFAGLCGICRSLKHLDLTQCNITDATLLAIAGRCKRLKSLKLSSCSEITDAGIEALVTNCRELEVLNLDNCGLITDRALAMIGDCSKRLKQLNVSWCMNITDKGVMDVVNGCDQLQVIWLVWCTQLTMICVEALLKKRVKRVHLNGCRNISERLVDEARARDTQVLLSL